MSHTQQEIEAVQQSFQPAGSRVAILIDDFKYKGNLVIPDKYKSLPTTGIIVCMGPAAFLPKEHESVDTDSGFFSIGDRVLLNIYSGTLVSIQNKPAYRVVEIAEILGKIAKDDILEYTGA